MEDLMPPRKYSELSLSDRAGNWWPRTDGLWELDATRPYYRHFSKSDFKREAYMERVRLRRLDGLNV